MPCELCMRTSCVVYVFVVISVDRDVRRRGLLVPAQVRSGRLGTKVRAADGSCKGRLGSSTSDDVKFNSRNSSGSGCHEGATFKSGKASICDDKVHSSEYGC